MGAREFTGEIEPLDEPISFRTEDDLRRAVQFTPEEQAANLETETSERTRAELEAAIAAAPNPQARDALVETYARDFLGHEPSRSLPGQEPRSEPSAPQPPSVRAREFTGEVEPIGSEPEADSVADPFARYGAGYFGTAASPIAKKEEEPSVIGQAGRGLAKGLTGMAGAVGSVMQFAGERLGAKGFADYGKRVADAWEEVGKNFDPDKSIEGSILDNPELLTKGAWWAYNVSNILPSFAASAVPAVGTYRTIKVLGEGMKWTPQLVHRLAQLGGALVGGASGGALEGAQTYQEVQKRGGSEEEAAAAGSQMALASAALNALSLGKLTSQAKNAVTKFLKTGVWEGLTEWAEEPAEGAILGRTSVAGPQDDPALRAREGFNVFPVAALTGGLGGAATGTSRGRAPVAEEDPIDVEPDLSEEAPPVAIDRGVASTSDQEARQRLETLPENDPALALQRIEELASEIEAANAEGTEEGLLRASELEAERDSLFDGLLPIVARGRQTGFTTEAGARIDAEFAAVEAGQLTASHTPDMRANPEYPVELQPRDRSRAASELQVAKITGNLEPMRLGESGDAGTGAPIIGADGLVESGNARTIGIQRAYIRGTPQAQRYRDWVVANASQFGIDPDEIANMRAPVVVRVRRTPVNRVEFAQQANQAAVARMSPAEQARADAGRMGSLEGLTINEDGEFMVPANDGIIRGFFRSLPITEQASLVDQSGRISQAGYMRFRNALLAKAYGDHPVLERLTESTSPLLRNLTNALIRMAPNVAKAKEEMQQGAMAERDITGDLVRAVDEIVRMRIEGRDLGHTLAQMDAFESLAPEVVALMEFIDENVRSPARIAQFVQAYLDELRRYGSEQQGDMFGGVEVPGRAELIETARGKVAPDGEGQNEQAQGEPVVRVGTEAPQEPAAADAAAVGDAGAAAVPSADAAGEERADEPDRGAVGDAGAGEGAVAPAVEAEPEPVAPATETGDNAAAPPAASDESPEGATRSEATSPPIPDQQAQDEGGSAAEAAAPEPEPDAATKIAEASREAAHSPENDKPLPTQAQIEAGNYPVGHLRLFGLDISIESPKGSTRSGVDSDGEQWRVKMQAAYGYIRRTEGKDGDHVDVYLTGNPTEQTPVFVVDQIDPATGRFDEHKLIIGAESQAEAEALYDVHFSDKSGPQRRGAVRQWTLERLKTWLKTGNTKRPVAYKEPKRVEPQKRSEPAAEPARIEDVGEKIGGARKDLWRDRGLNVADMEGMAGGEQAQYATKDNVWPKIEYAKRITDGMEPKAAALLKIIRDGIAARPRRDTPEERRTYVETLGILRDLVNADILARRGGVTVADVKALAGKLASRLGIQLRTPGYGGPQARANLQKLWAIYRGRTNPVRISYREERRADQMLAAGWPVPGKAERQGGARDTAKMPERPHLDRLDRTGEDVRGGRDIAGKELLEAFGFRGIEYGNWAAQDERQRMLNLAFEALHDLASVLGIPPKALSLNGTLGLAFGARGGGKAAAHYEPGKLVVNLTKLRGAGTLAHEWAHALDHYFGELGRPDAYQGSARGASGWYTRVTAKRENLRPEVAKAFEDVMTALFKRTLSKAEMVRALELDLEKVQARIAEEKNEANREFYQRRITSMEANLAEARGMDDTKRYPSGGQSSFATEAVRLSGKSGSSGYWARPTEMFARAFEAYVFDKLAADDRVSQYLVQGVEADRYASGYKGNPYPTGEERQRINEAFDDLVATLQTRETERGVALFSRGDDIRFAANALTELAATDDLFRYPVSKSSDLETVFAEVALGIEALGNATRPEENRDSGADRRFMFRTDKGKDFYVYERGRDIWIDVSRLDPGDAGSAIYAAVLNYAHNAGKRLVGDPAGLSTDAIVRRTSAMLSSALRFGTTEHMAPAREQRDGDAARNIAPLNWGASDFENLQNLIDAHLSTLYARIPSIRDLRYDFVQQRFLDPSGRHLGREYFKRLAETSDSREARAGEATLRRAVLLQSLVSSPSGARPPILRAVLSRALQLAREGDLAGTFSRTEGPAEAGLSASGVRERIDAITSRWANAPKVVVVQSMQDPDVPQRVRDEDAKQRSQGASGAPEGFWYGGKAYIVLDGIASADDAVRVLLHETLGHYGLRGVFGDRLNEVLDRLAAGRPSDVAAKARQYGLDIRKVDERRQAAEEVLAELAQTKPELGIVRRAIAAIRNFLRDLGVALEMSDADIVQQYILPARGFVERGRGKARGPIAFHRAYHGSPHRFDRFSLDKIGTGEGAQAYGHGLYFAENRGVAESYRTTLSMERGFDFGGRSGLTRDQVQDLVAEQYGTEFLDGVTRPSGVADQVIDNIVYGSKASLPRGYKPGSQRAKLYEDLREQIKHTDGGALYEVEISDEAVARMLDWDKPLSEQAPEVRDALDELRESIAPDWLEDALDRVNADWSELTGQEAYRLTQRAFEDDALVPSAEDIDAAVVAGRRDEAASRFLLSLGVPGIRYLDSSSRRQGAGTRNLVVFDDSLVNIEARFSRKAPAWVDRQTPETQEALRKAGVWYKPKTFRDRINEWMPGWEKRVRQGLVDQFDPIKEYDYRAYMLARLTKGSDAALEGLLMHGTIYLDKDGAVDVNYEKGGFLGVLSKLNGEHDRFLSWVIGQRAAELMAQGRERNFTAQDIARLRALNRGQMPGGKSRAAEYQKALADLQRYNNAVLDMAEKAGLIDGASRKIWQSQFYVPFYRFIEEEQSTKGPLNPSGLVKQYAFKKLKGGTQELGDPVENTLRNWSHMIGAALRNQSAVAAIQAAEKLGAARKVPADTKGAVFVVENGKNVHYEIDDPFLLDALKSIGFMGFQGPAMKVMQTFKRWLTLGVTVSPTFRIRNIIRDSIAMIGANPASYNVLNNVLTGWKGTKEGSPDFARILSGGGVMRFGTWLEGDRAPHVKRMIESSVPGNTILNTPQKLRAALRAGWDWWQHTGDRAENVNRVALYKKLRAEGKSHLEASYAARDVMDFSMGGTWAAVRFLAQTVPFFNARLQGAYKLGRGAMEDPRRFATVLGAVTMASIALLLAYEDDEDWKKREDWDRESFWWFKIGDTAYRIPKPFEIGALASIAERGVEAMTSDELTGKQFAERVWAILMEQMSMNPVPQLVKPAIEIWANRDSFTDRPIETMGMERLSKSERSSPYTSEVAKLAGKAGVLSPVQVDHLVRAYFGWLGVHVVMTADFAVRPLTGAPEKPERRLDDYFVVGDFVKELPAYQSKYVTRLYDQSKKAQEAMADVRHYREIGELEKASEVAEDKKDEIAVYRLYTRAQRQMSKINKRIRLVQQSDLNAKEKRERLDALYDQRNRLARLTEERARARRESSQQ